MSHLFLRLLQAHSTSVDQQPASLQVDRGSSLKPVQLEPVTMLVSIHPSALADKVAKLGASQLGKDGRGDMTTAVVSLYHRVNPKWGCSRLKRIVKVHRALQLSTVHMALSSSLL